MARSKRFESRLRMWCSRCRRWIVVPDDRLWQDICPLCDRNVATRRCTRCGYEWYPRSLGRMPLYCANPMCGSPYWNRERVRDVDMDEDVLPQHGPMMPAQRRPDDRPDSMLASEGLDVRRECERKMPLKEPRPKTQKELADEARRIRAMPYPEDVDIGWAKDRYGRKEE